MKILFDENAVDGLKNMLENSSENYIRIKPFYGCGRPAFEVFADYKKETDICEIIEGISFVVNADDEKACSELQIKYNKEIYNNNGFYIKSL